MECAILVPQPGIEHPPPALAVQSLNHWNTWEVPAAAAAKSLQSCLTLWDPIDDSPPGSPVLRILQARILEWVPFPSPMHACMLSCFSCVQLCATQGQQPTRLPCPWDSQGKNPGVGCHFLLQCMKVKSESEVVLSCPTLSDPMDCSLPGSSIHGILQARVLEWGTIAFSILPYTAALFLINWMTPCWLKLIKL